MIQAGTGTWLPISQNGNTSIEAENELCYDARFELPEGTIKNFAKLKNREAKLKNREFLRNGLFVKFKTREIFFSLRDIEIFQGKTLSLILHLTEILRLI